MAYQHSSFNSKLSEKALKTHISRPPLRTFTQLFTLLLSLYRLRPVVLPNVVFDCLAPCVGVALCKVKGGGGEGCLCHIERVSMAVSPLLPGGKALLLGCVAHVSLLCCHEMGAS